MQKNEVGIDRFNVDYLKSSPGFTIVELLVVIVVIGILAAITIIAYTGISQKAIATSLKSDLTSDTTQLKLYQIDHGTFPSGLNGSNCPTGPVDANYCLKTSPGTTLTYEPNPTDYLSYNLYASSSSGMNYRLTDNNQTTIQTSLVCPLNFIIVPGSSTYGTSDFCVMKYEAKQVGATTTPISQAGGLPWVNLSQTDSITNSPNVVGCTGCHLITEAQWLTIAQNALNVAYNWSGGSVGNGFIFSGHNDNAPANALVADSNDSSGYAGETNTGGNQRRTLMLSNSEVIWDFPGNVEEWTSGSTTGNQPGISGGGFLWRDYTAITTHGTLSPDPFPATTGISGASGWTSAQGIGQIFSNSDVATLEAFFRGGRWSTTNEAGVLSFSLGHPPTDTMSYVGFRVTK
jgi:prepilin-type N-terminal cleavage/methylation domain-containing protein